MNNPKNSKPLPADHAERIKAGQARAKAAGKQLGRPKESLDTYLEKPKNRQIIDLIMQRGASIRQTAIIASCSAATVQNVLKIYYEKHPDKKPLRLRPKRH